MFRENFIGVLVAVMTVTVFWAMPAFADCTKDTDCKADRICVQGSCVYPKKTRTVQPRSDREYTPKRHYRDSYDRDRRYRRARRRSGMKVGFGASVLTGFRWGGFGWVGSSFFNDSIADIFAMNVDINLGVCLDRRNGSRFMLGMGFRPTIFKGRVPTMYDIYLFKFRAQRSVVTGSVGVGLRVWGGKVFYALQGSFGLGFNVGNHLAINVDLLDINYYYDFDSILGFDFNMLFGLSMHF